MPVVAPDLYADGATALLASAVGTAPASGTSETWTVQSATYGTAYAQWPLASLTLGMVRAYLPGNEIIWITNMGGTGNNTWTVLRAMEGTTAVTYASSTLITACLTAGAMAAARGFVWLAAEQWGMDNTGANSAGVNDTILANMLSAAYARSPYRGAIIEFGPGTYRFDKPPQFVSSGGTSCMAPSIIFQGAGCSNQTLSAITGGTILDLRYDGTTGDPFLNDYAVVSGLDLVWTRWPATSVNNLTISRGTAYINNTDTLSTSLKNLYGSGGSGGSATDTLTWYATNTGLSGGTALAAGDYFLDVAPNGTSAMTPTSSAAGTNQGTWATNAIRIGRVTVNGSGLITNVVDWRGRLAKLDLRHQGTVVFRDLDIACLDATRTSDEVPLLRSTLTIPQIERVRFIGSASASVGISAVQDAVVLGGMGGKQSGEWNGSQFISQPGAPGVANGGTAYSVFGGYGGYVSNCLFSNIRRSVYGRANCNAIPFTNLATTNGCGRANGGLVEFDAHQWNPCYGCTFLGGDFELQLASYAILNINNAGNMTIVGAAFSDPNAQTLGGSSSGTSLVVTDMGTANGQTPMTWKGAAVAIDASGITPEVNRISPTAAVSGANPSGGATTGTGTSGLFALTVSQATGFSNGQTIIIGSGSATQESNVISSGAGTTTLTLQNALAHTYSAVSIGVAPWTFTLVAALAVTHASGAKLSTSVSAFRGDTTSAVNTTLLGCSFGGQGMLDATDASATSGAFAAGNAVIASAGSTTLLGGIQVINSSAPGTSAGPIILPYTNGGTPVADMALSSLGGGNVTLSFDNTFNAQTEVYFGANRYLFLYSRGLRLESGAFLFSLGNQPGLSANATHSVASLIGNSTDTSGILQFVVTVAATTAAVDLCLVTFAAQNGALPSQPRITLTPIVDATGTGAPPGLFYANQTASATGSWAPRCSAALPVGTYRLAYHVIAGS